MTSRTNPSEAVIQAEILRACCRGGTRLFRNHVGQGWSGQLVRREGDLIVLQNARPARFGLCDGSSDLIGWHTGSDGIARFLAVEVKSASGRLSEGQRNFIAAVQRAGGIAGIARSPEDVARLLGEGVLV